jgi:hypothetical protein
MSQQTFRIYRFQPYNQNNPQLHEYSNHILHNSNMQTNNQNLLNIVVTSLAPWRPSQRLRSLYTRFQNTTLCQYRCLPCAFCGKLLYPAKAKWVPYNENYLYPLEKNFPNCNIYIRDGDLSCTVCVCNSCKSSRK